jgi:hypothetical protein
MGDGGARRRRMSVPAAHTTEGRGSSSPRFPLGEPLVHVAVAEQEALIQPHRMAEELPGESVALIKERGLGYRGVLRRGPSKPPGGVRDSPESAAATRCTASR